MRQHFGLDEHTSADKLVIEWPASGTMQIFLSVPANQTVEITEGCDVLVAKEYPQAEAVASIS